MVPMQKWWQAPYFWAGCKAYDFLAGSEGIESSYFLTHSKALDAFPMLKKDELFGAMVYYGKVDIICFRKETQFSTDSDCRWSTQRLPYERLLGNDRRSLWQHSRQSLGGDGPD